MISSGELPDSMSSTIWLTRIRVPAIRGAPPQVPGVDSMCDFSLIVDMLQLYHTANVFGE